MKFSFDKFLKTLSDDCKLRTADGSRVVVCRGKDENGRPLVSFVRANERGYPDDKPLALVGYTKDDRNRTVRCLATYTDGGKAVCTGTTRMTNVLMRHLASSIRMDNTIEYIKMTNNSKECN